MPDKNVKKNPAKGAKAPAGKPPVKAVPAKTAAKPVKAVAKAPAKPPVAAKPIKRPSSGVSGLAVRVWTLR